MFYMSEKDRQFAAIEVARTLIEQGRITPSEETKKKIMPSPNRKNRLTTPQIYEIIMEAAPEFKDLFEHKGPKVALEVLEDLRKANLENYRPQVLQHKDPRLLVGFLLGLQGDCEKYYAQIFQHNDPISVFNALSVCRSVVRAIVAEDMREKIMNILSTNPRPMEAEKYFSDLLRNEALTDAAVNVVAEVTNAPDPESTTKAILMLLKKGMIKEVSRDELAKFADILAHPQVYLAAQLVCTLYEGRLEEYRAQILQETNPDRMSSLNDALKILNPTKLLKGKRARSIWGKLIGNPNAIEFANACISIKEEQITENILTFLSTAKKPGLAFKAARVLLEDQFLAEISYAELQEFAADVFSHDHPDLAAETVQTLTRCGLEEHRDKFLQKSSLDPQTHRDHMVLVNRALEALSERQLLGLITVRDQAILDLLLSEKGYLKNGSGFITEVGQTILDLLWTHPEPLEIANTCIELASGSALTLATLAETQKLRAPYFPTDVFPEDKPRKSYLVARAISILVAEGVIEEFTPEKLAEFSPIFDHFDPEGAAKAIFTLVKYGIDKKEEYVEYAARILQPTEKFQHECTDVSAHYIYDMQKERRCYLFRALEMLEARFLGNLRPEVRESVLDVLFTSTPLNYLSVAHDLCAALEQSLDLDAGACQAIKDKYIGKDKNKEYPSVAESLALLPARPPIELDPTRSYETTIHTFATEVELFDRTDNVRYFALYTNGNSYYVVVKYSLSGGGFADDPSLFKISVDVAVPNSFEPPTKDNTTYLTIEEDKPYVVPDDFRCIHHQSKRPATPIEYYAMSFQEIIRKHIEKEFSYPDNLKPNPSEASVWRTAEALYIELPLESNPHRRGVRLTSTGVPERDEITYKISLDVLGEEIANLERLLGEPVNPEKVVILTRKKEEPSAFPADAVAINDFVTVDASREISAEEKASIPYMIQRRAIGPVMDPVFEGGEAPESPRSGARSRYALWQEYRAFVQNAPRHRDDETNAARNEIILRR